MPPIYIHRHFPIPIYLYSDFGSTAFVLQAELSVFLARTFQILTITHELQYLNYAYAGAILTRSMESAKNPSWHLVFFDIYKDTATTQRIIYSRHKNQHVLCMDNGWVDYIPKDGERCIVPVSTQESYPLLSLIVRTMHSFITRPNRTEGLEIYASKLQIPPPYEREDDALRCRILSIDDFDNVILSIRRSDFEAERQGRNFEIPLMKNTPITEYAIRRIHEHPSQVAAGEMVAFFNDLDYLELSIKYGSMANFLGFTAYKKKVIQENWERIKPLFYELVSIYFLP